MKNVFLFDWDDTLCPTTFLQKSKYRIFTVEEFKLLLELQSEISILLKKAKSRGIVKIVTNAKKQWVYYIRHYYLHNLDKALENVEIISARDCYEHITTCGRTWKRNVFKKEIPINSHVISLGDTYLDRSAFLDVVTWTDNIIFKFFKLLICPTLLQLKCQLQCINKIFDDVCSSKRNMDMTLNHVFDNNEKEKILLMCNNLCKKYKINLQDIIKYMF